MTAGYRTWAERREIISSMIAETNPPAIETFQLSASEEVFFRARSRRAVAELAKTTSTFKSYYALPAARPFFYVLGVSGLVVVGAVAFAVYLWLRSANLSSKYPLLAACATLAVAAIGWAVAGGITHRNTVRQNTNNILFARFTQTPFGDAMHRFHKEFGHDIAAKVTVEKWRQLRDSGCDEESRAATSVTYLLNYFEFIASGVLRGDLDQKIVRDNIRGVVSYYHDKCWPFILSSNQQNPKVYENLIKLRTHYREP